MRGHDNGQLPAASRERLAAWLDARRLTMADLKLAGCHWARHRAHGFVVTWPYTFADGSKATRMLALDLPGGPGWRNDGPIRGAVMVLGDVQRASTVLVTEGESDALAAHVRRPSPELAVLCLPGAGMVPDDLANRIGNGARVVLASDADEAGDECAAKAARVLEVAGIAPAHIRRLRPAVEGLEAPDLRDQLATLDAGEEEVETAFARLIKEAPRWSGGGLEAPSTPDAATVCEAPSTFPVDVLPDAAARLVREGAAALPCPPDYLSVPMLAAAAAAVGGQRSVRVKEGWFERAGLYLPVVGAPGTLKSPALALALAPVHAYQEELNDNYRQLRAEWEATCAALDNKSERPPEPAREVMFTTDATVEALAAILAREGGGRGILVSPDELAGWARGIGQYKSGRGADRQKWLEAWAGLPWDVERVGRSLYVPHPFVVLTGGMQPDTLGTLLDESGADDGMVDRMLATYPDEVPRVASDQEVSQEAQRAWGLLWRRVREWTSEGGFVHLAPGARARFKDWQGELFARQELADDGERGALAKLDGHVARLALVLHELWLASEEADETYQAVSEDVMARAIRLGEYFAGHFQRVHVEGVAASRRLVALRGRGGLVDGAPVSGRQRAEVAARILHELATHGRMTLAGVARAVGRPPKDQTVRRALSHLQQAGKVSRDDRGRYGVQS
jgi:hypothetical protein